MLTVHEQTSVAQYMITFPDWGNATFLRPAFKFNPFILRKFVFLSSERFTLVSIFVRHLLLGSHHHHLYSQGELRGSKLMENKLCYQDNLLSGMGGLSIDFRVP